MEIQTILEQFYTNKNQNGNNNGLSFSIPSFFVFFLIMILLKMDPWIVNGLSGVTDVLFSSPVWR